MKATVWLATSLILTSASPCAAQEIVLVGPLRGACIATCVRMSVPSPLEWSYWVSSGATYLRWVGNDQLVPFIAVGVELTTGFPDHEKTWTPHRAWRPDPRVGVWANAEARGLTSPGALVETGLTAHLGMVDEYRSTWGAFDLRAGFGYGAFPNGRAPELAVGFGWGYRIAFDRYTWGGACDAVPQPPAVADVTFVRIVTMLRGATTVSAFELQVGIEVTPTVALLARRFDTWGCRNENRRLRKDR